MGQSWWWVVLAVAVVVALFVVVALLRARRGRDSAAAVNVTPVNVAAAGGVAGAVGAGAVAAAHAEDEASASVDESSLDQPDEPDSGPEASEPDSGAETPDSQPSALAEDLPEPRAAGRLDTPSPESDGAATTLAGASASIPAPREEQPLSGSSRGTPDPRTPGPAGSALSAIDSGLVGPASSVAAAAAAVSAAAARPGPYPGSLLPAEDGSSPSPDHQVKANEGSRRFHTPDSPFYLRTRGDAWFHTADEARAAGFTAWDA